MSADPGGLLYGAIVSAAVLVTVSAHAEDTDYVVISTSVFLVVYWLAHVYIETLSTQFRGDKNPFARRLRHAAGHEAGVLKGGAPAILVYTLVSLLGAEPSTASAIAAYFSVLLLVVIGYLGAHGRRTRVAAARRGGRGGQLRRPDRDRQEPAALRLRPGRSRSGPARRTAGR